MVVVTVTVVIVTAAAPIDNAHVYSSGRVARGGVAAAWGRCKLFLTELGGNLYLTRSSARALASSVATVFDGCTRFLLRPATRLISRSTPFSRALAAQVFTPRGCSQKPGRKVKLFGTLSRTDDSSSSNNKLTRATRKT